MVSKQGILSTLQMLAFWAGLVGDLVTFKYCLLFFVVGGCCGGVCCSGFCGW